MIQSRRGFLTGLGGLVLSGPAIVRASSLMKIKPNPMLAWYKGRMLADAGFYYAPYVPIYQTVVRSGYKMRYIIGARPITEAYPELFKSEK